MKKLRKNIREGVSSIKLNEELIDNDELQVKLDELTNQFHIKYNDFEQKINETEEGITNLQTEHENEVKTNTAERIRIAESISSVKRDLVILSEQLASNTEGRTLAAELRMAKRRLDEVNSDLVSLIVENKNEIVKLQ